MSPLSHTDDQQAFLFLQRLSDRRTTSLALCMKLLPSTGLHGASMSTEFDPGLVLLSLLLHFSRFDDKTSVKNTSCTVLECQQCWENCSQWEHVENRRHRRFVLADILSCQLSLWASAARRFTQTSWQKTPHTCNGPEPHGSANVTGPGPTSSQD